MKNEETLRFFSIFFQKTGINAPSTGKKKGVKKLDFFEKRLDLVEISLDFFSTIPNLFHLSPIIVRPDVSISSMAFVKIFRIFMFHGNGVFLGHGTGLKQATSSPQKEGRVDKKHYANLPTAIDWHSWGRMVNSAIYFFSSSISSKYCPHSEDL